MPNILEASISRRALEELVDAIYNTFTVIAFSDHYKDAKWTWKRAQSIKREYADAMEVISPEDLAFHLGQAYDVLGDLLKYPPEERRRIAEETYYDHLHRDEEGPAPESD